MNVRRLAHIACLGLSANCASCCDSCRSDGPRDVVEQDAGIPRYDGPWCGTKDCPCEPASREVKDGHLVRCELSERIVLQGFPVVGSIEFNGQGSLLSFRLHEAHAIDGVRCRAGSAVQRFQTGRLKECSPDDVQRVGDIACSRTVALHLDGSLRRCELAEPRTFGAVQLPARAWVTLFPSGKLERFEAYAEAVEVRDLRCRGSFNYLFENGQLKQCLLAAGAKVGDRDYPAGATVCFDETGGLRDCAPARSKPSTSGP